MEDGEKGKMEDGEKGKREKWNVGKLERWKNGKLISFRFRLYFRERNLNKWNNGRTHVIPECSYWESQ